VTAASLLRSPITLCLAACLAAACTTTRPLPRDQVPAAIQTARGELGEGRTEEALELMRRASVTEGLDPATRDEVQQTLETVVERRIEELSRPGADPEDLADLVDLELPRQMAVNAGLRAARGLFQEGEAVDAYRLLRKLDAKYPQHHERYAAGELLIDMGLWLVEHGTGWFGIGHSTEDAEQVLEYVLLHHPATPRCDEAYETLARIYEDDREWRAAIERLELLVLNHPNSPRRPGAQANIPHLRLRSLYSPEYDRSQLLTARKELETWLASYAGHELERQVRADLRDSILRLCDSDLMIARFYERVGAEHGTRYHALRAAEEARSAGDDERVKEALALVPPSPEPVPEPAGAPAPQAKQGGAP
jgi:outer membrane protein assembly factor BamD (BamD/ComL family)